MVNWKQKLTSRKWWTALIGFVSNVLYALNFAQSTVERVSALILSGACLIAYTIAEGLIDASRDEVQLIEVEQDTAEDESEDEGVGKV